MERIVNNNMDKKYIEYPRKFNKKEYDKEYNKNMYKVLSVRLKPADYEHINEYCMNKGLTKTELILTALYDYIDRH